MQERVYAKLADVIHSMTAAVAMQLAVAGVFGLIQARHSAVSSGLHAFASILFVLSLFSTTLFVGGLPFAFQFDWKHHTPATASIVAIAIWFVARALIVCLTAPPTGAARTTGKSL